MIELVHSEGYKITIKIREEKERIEKQHEVSVCEEKIDPVQYLESKLEKEIACLEEHRDLPGFFEKIGFVDKDKIVERVYNHLINTEYEIEKAKTKMYNFRKVDMYYNSFAKVFEDVAIECKKIVREQLRIWLKEYHSLFPLYIRISTFLKLLLKHTGYEYY